MTDLENIKQYLNNAAKITPKKEWDEILEFIKDHPEYSFEFLLWVCCESLCYWESRSKAGIELIKLNQSEGWNIVEKLIQSNNPDDRGTALEILERANDPRGFELAKLLLDDQVAGLQLDAAEFLRGNYKEDVKKVLTKLITHENTEVRKQAQKMLTEL